MKIFINDKTITIVGTETIEFATPFNSVLNQHDELISKKLVGHVLVKGATTHHIERLLKLLQIKKLKKMLSITFQTKYPDTLKEFFKDEFKIVKASGGLVIKEHKFLMIYRLGKWDLPKGKLNKKESSENGAVREVEEECNIKVKLNNLICSTWHTYISKDKNYLKKTDWYTMDCLNEDTMKPQTEEGIEEIRWMAKEEVAIALENSYKSIHMVFDAYDEMLRHA